MWNISWRRICTWFYHSITLSLFSLLIPLDFFIIILFTRLRFESLSWVREIRKSCLYLYAVLSFFHNCKAFLAMSSIIFSPNATTNKVDQQHVKQSWQNACCRHNNGHFYHVGLMKYETSWQITAVDSEQSCRHNLKCVLLRLLLVRWVKLEWQVRASDAIQLL